MARKPKRDQLSVVGLVSAILRGTAQQRSLAKSKERKANKRAEKEQKKREKAAKPKDTRTPEEIGRTIDSTRTRLVGTVDAVKYDLDVPARARDLRNTVAARIPRRWRGEPGGMVVGAAVLVVGWGGLALAALFSTRGRSAR